ncbi:P-loop NTPase fold protein [Pseudomonas sp. lyk4-R2A-10]|uniref:KAP family P-loop NTPase fold protein n=1 Tax=Pseudomonas sp. lyk4-R2A-10 TaxID=3040315 RepID=UPI0025538A4E|nr:P-loop NTPase fold protein [Pseudomonas sp. lyk4-R2A-10]
MDLHDSYGFAADRPISKAEDDLLGRAEFSNSLASALSSWHGRDSLVVALHGDWGAGKTSIKNMAISRLESIKKDPPSVIEFSPWEWAAQEKITASFFQEISRSIGRKDDSSEGKKLAKTLKKYGKYLNTGETVITSFSAALPTLFVIATLAGLGGSFSDSAWVKTTSASIIAALAVCAGVLKWGKNILEKISGDVGAAAKENEQSLSDIRKELSKLLSARKSSLIVVMDDLDRLTSDQLRMVFQLIKANLEFPNVVFLLLFQRDLVEEKLSNGKHLGREYLEKIIQVPFDIPKIEKTRLHNVLFNKLDAILKSDKSALEMFDSGRWGSIFNTGLHLYFDNLRNIYRYTSTLSFHFSLLKGRTTFEVNPIDLFVIECLRVFEPDVYRELARSKEILTKNGIGKHEKEDSTAKLIASILEKSHSSTRSTVEKLIKYLFPTIEWAIGGTGYSGEYLKTWHREMRVCHHTNFDKYFQLSIPDGELSNSDLQEMLSLTSSAEDFAAFIITLKERGILKNSLAQFESFSEIIPTSDGYDFIKGILDIGDVVDHEVTGYTMFSSNTHLVRLVVAFLRRVEDIEDRGMLLLRCFQNTTGISIVEHILQSEENRREKSDANLVLLDNEFNKLKDEFVNKLDEMANNRPSELINHEHLVSFLYRWSRWGDKNKVIEWLKSETKSEEGAILLLKGFLTKISSYTIGDHSSTTNQYIKLESIEEFIDINHLKQCITNINLEKYDQQSTAAVIAFREAIERRETGVADEW